MVVFGRGMTLLELMVTMSAVAVVATAGAASLAEQVKRARATDAANSALYPHTVSRDRSVAARTCTETVLVPALPDFFFTDISDFPPNSQRAVPRVAVIEWSDCELTATIARIQFFDLDGDITLQPYDSDDGRLVFGIRGGLTAERPGASSGAILRRGAPCGAAGGGSVAEGEGEEGEGEDGREGESEESCEAPLAFIPVVADVNFEATTFFGRSVHYTVFARAGATESH
jgi:prepilin-type N-terminal cleavage/methylation domain-containing protein